MTSTGEASASSPEACAVRVLVEVSTPHQPWGGPILFRHTVTGHPSNRRADSARLKG